MKLKTILIMVLISGGLLSCSDNASKSKDNDNPFFKSYNTPFNVPPFDEIKGEHFEPAFNAGMAEQKENIAGIINTKEEPTFANTIEALENSGILLTKVKTVFSNLSSANTTPEIEDINSRISPVMSAHSDEIYMNASLFKKVKAVYDKKNQLNLTQEQEVLLTKTYKSFVRNGINLDEAKQERLREINAQLSMLMVQFGKNLLDEMNRFQLVIEKEEDLQGLPQSVVETAAKVAVDKGLEGKWVFTLHNPSATPFLQYVDNRELRKKMYEGYIQKGNYGDSIDNKETAAKIAALRVEKAQLLGYKNHASYVLEEATAKTPENVNDLLNQMWGKALNVAKKEADQMQQLMRKTDKKAKFEAYDWAYYAEKVRKEKYSLDAEEVRPYFQLENVREGIFTLCDKLYGLTFIENREVPLYHPDVKAYEVKDNDGSHLGLVYLDYYTRASKRSGAWMTSYNKTYRENGKRVAPVITVVFNFSSPSGEGVPALLTADEVETFFHEFGHALHGLFGNTQYYSLSGTAVPRDFVEFPSQVLENWAFEPELLNTYAKHYKTGEVIPSALIKKMEDASKFNQGFATVEYLAASILDMGYHTLETITPVDVAKFEKALMDKIGLIPQIAPRYRSTYFQHIFAGGYSSGYYSYIWSEVLDSDTYQFFKESGTVFNKEIATSFRKNLLEKGGTEDPMDMYRAFRGKNADTKYLMEKRGLN